MSQFNFFNGRIILKYNFEYFAIGMEPVEPMRKNTSQRRDCRKRVVTKNEFKRVSKMILYYC